MAVIPIDTCICRLMPIFFIYWFYSYFARVLILVLFIIALFVMILLIWSCRKYFVILWHHSILVIALNKLFVSARCLHKSRILLIGKNIYFWKDDDIWCHSKKIIWRWSKNNFCGITFEKVYNFKDLLLFIPKCSLNY